MRAERQGLAGSATSIPTLENRKGGATSVKLKSRKIKSKGGPAPPRASYQGSAFRSAAKHG